MRTFQCISVGVLASLAALSIAANTQTSVHAVLPNQTLSIYKNGQLIKQVDNHSDKPIVIHLQGDGQYPLQETIQLEESGPHSQSHEVIEFSNQVSHLQSTQLFDDVMRDQQHEEVMMQQLLHTMNRHLNVEMDQVNQDELDSKNQAFQADHAWPAFKGSAPMLDADHENQTWWGLFKSYF